MENTSKLEKLIRDGIFLAASRTYGEQYIEPLIRSHFNLSEPKGNDYDAIDRSGKKFEIKASKVLKQTGNMDKKKSIVDRIIFENDNLPTNRLVSFHNSGKSDYGANIQNVKRDHFEELFYVLLFEDCMKVFKVHHSKISSIPNWSDKHGRYDQLGKSGQFAVNKSNIEWHLEKCLVETFTYKYATEVYNKIK